MARRVTYEETIKPNLDLIKGWSRNGLTMDEICYNIGISHATILKWAESHPELDKALKHRRDEADIKVENALYRRAIGFQYKEKVWEYRLNPATGDHELILTRVTQKHVIPDVTAQLAWLTNRAPHKWKKDPQTTTAKSDSDEKIKNWLKAVKFNPKQTKSLYKNADGTDTLPSNRADNDDMDEDGTLN